MKTLILLLLIQLTVIATVSAKTSRFHYKGAPLSVVVESLREISIENDHSTRDPNKKGINIVLLDPKNIDPNVRIKLKNVSFETALNLITQSVGFKWEIVDDTVVISEGADQDVNLETDFVPINKSALLRILGRRI